MFEWPQKCPDHWKHGLETLDVLSASTSGCHGELRTLGNVGLCFFRGFERIVVNRLKWVVNSPPIGFDPEPNDQG